MKAVRFHELGGPEVLCYEDAPDPVVGPDDVLIRVEAAGINYSDTLFRQGRYAFFAPQLPQIPGTEVAGVIVETGARVPAGLAGRRVMAILSSVGGYAQYVAIPHERALPIPDQIGFAEAAAIPIQGLSAYQVLRYSARIQTGESILVHAAAGGVGTFMVQMAKVLGAAPVIGTASSEEKLELARSLGADAAINYVERAFVPEVLALTAGRGADVINETVGGDVFLKSIDCLAPFGRLIVVGAASGGRPSFDPSVLLPTNRAVIGYFIRPFLPLQDIMAESVGTVTGWVVEGKVRPVIGAAAPLRDAAALHARLVSRKTTGKLVLLPWA
jgi:NADPH2:quinone reductase